MKKWLRNWRKQFKFAIYDPRTFNEIFEFTTSKIRIVSLITLTFFFINGIFIFILMNTPLRQYLASSSTTEHSLIKEQRLRMDSLSLKVKTQETYIRDLKRLMFGDFKHDSLKTEQPDLQINSQNINPNPSVAEIQIGENVKKNQYTNSPNAVANIVHFMSPTKGKISQQFIAEQHEAIDVVTPPNSYFSACLSGTVIFSGYSSKDGNVLIIEHPNDFLSIYKHAKTLLKKRGDKVRTGDLIGIVGNTGTNTTGPHLHFELWLNQQSVDPENYMNFE